MSDVRQEIAPTGSVDGYLDRSVLTQSQPDQDELHDIGHHDKDGVSTVYAKRLHRIGHAVGFEIRLAVSQEALVRQNKTE